jgi:hypothetical protein
MLGKNVVYGEFDRVLGNYVESAAIVTRVFGPEMVNLTVFADGGKMSHRSSVPRKDSMSEQGLSAYWRPCSETPLSGQF